MWINAARQEQIICLWKPQNRSLDLVKGIKWVNGRWEMSFLLMFPHLWLINAAGMWTGPHRSPAGVSLGLCRGRGMSCYWGFWHKTGTKANRFLHCLSSYWLHAQSLFQKGRHVAPPLNERPRSKHTLENRASISGCLTHSMLISYYV